MKRLLLSAASAWEIVIKTAIGKLHTSRRPREDRLILAVASVEGLPIIISDAAFTAYELHLVDARS